MYIHYVSGPAPNTLKYIAKYIEGRQRYGRYEYQIRSRPAAFRHTPPAMSACNPNPERARRVSTAQATLSASGASVPDASPAPAAAATMPQVVISDPSDIVNEEEVVAETIEVAAVTVAVTEVATAMAVGMAVAAVAVCSIQGARTTSVADSHHLGHIKQVGQTPTVLSTLLGH